MTLDIKELDAAVEGILFAAGEPIHLDRICLALDLDKLSVQQILQRLGDYYAFERRGIRLVRMEDSYQLCSAPEYADMIRRAFEIRKTAKLSQPALEVLAIIAYYQPTTRAYVDQIRGVDSSYTVGLLVERKLIEEFWPSSPTTSPPPGPTWTRSVEWTALILWGFWWSASSLRSAAVFRCRGVPGSTGPLRIFSAPSI